MNQPRARKDYASPVELFPSVCRGERLWGLFLSINKTSQEDIIRQAPYLSGHQASCLAAEGFLVLLFNERRELDITFGQTGATGGRVTGTYRPQKNPVGKGGLYALTCDPTGELLDDNVPSAQTDSLKPAMFVVVQDKPVAAGAISLQNKEAVSSYTSLSARGPSR